MRVGVISGEPEHPLLAATARTLRWEHGVEFLDPEAGPGSGGEPERDDRGIGPGRLADVYLLKTQTARALALATRLAASGIPVINSVAATVRCQDRVEVAEVARAAGLPFVETARVTTGSRLAVGGSTVDGSADPGFPMVVKGRNSRRHDLVVRVDTPERLASLASAWPPQEPAIVQRFIDNSGWDHKLWVVGCRLFAARRRSALSTEGRGPDLPLPVADLPAEWHAAVLHVGKVLGLDVYGVDVVDAGGGAPLIVDVNAFPGGVGSQAGASEALAALALRKAGEARPRSGPLRLYGS